MWQLGSPLKRLSRTSFYFDYFFFFFFYADHVGNDVFNLFLNWKWLYFLLFSNYLFNCCAFWITNLWRELPLSVRNCVLKCTPFQASGPNCTSECCGTFHFWALLKMMASCLCCKHSVSWNCEWCVSSKCTWEGCGDWYQNSLMQEYEKMPEGSWAFNSLKVWIWHERSLTCILSILLL